MGLSVTNTLGILVISISFWLQPPAPSHSSGQLPRAPTVTLWKNLSPHALQLQPHVSKLACTNVGQIHGGMLDQGGCSWDGVWRMPPTLVLVAYPSICLVEFIYIYRFAPVADDHNPGIIAARYVCCSWQQWQPLHTWHPQTHGRSPIGMSHQSLYAVNLTFHCVFAQLHSGKDQRLEGRWIGEQRYRSASTIW